MKKTELLIKNSFGEKLDTWIEEPDRKVKANIILVHGFGTNKHETAGYFDDVSKALVSNHFRVVRFDFSGYGNSEGKQEDACYSKHIGDLCTMIEYIKLTFSEPIHIFAQSMGCFITALADPKGITKSLMTGLPNANTQVIIDRVIQRFGSRPGANLNLNGISELPRSTGQIQKIGPQFWLDIRKIEPVSMIKQYSLDTELLIIHWENDEIIGRDYLDAYDSISTLKSLWLPGDHSVTKPDDRANFIKVILDFLNT